MNNSTCSATGRFRYARLLQGALGAIALCLVSLLPAQMIPEMLALQGPVTGPGPLFETSLGNSVDYGQAVALDGDTLVVGTPNHYPDPLGNDTGKVFVYRRSGTVWTLEQALEPLAAGYVNFGHAVDIDENTIVIGAYGLSDWNGGIYVFERNGTTWTQVARRTATSDADYFGETVAISGDLIVAGHRQDTSFRGAVHTFERNAGGAGNWGETAKLMAHDAVNSDEFGTSVAISGTTLAVGAAWDDDKGLSSGSAYVYTRGAGTWTLQQKLVAANGIANDRFGNRVALAGDLLAVGTANSGATRDNLYLFGRSGGLWSDSQTLRSTGGVSDLEISGNAIAAGSGDFYPDGAAHLFTKIAGAWSLTRTFRPPDVYRRNYGRAVAVDDDTLALGDPLEYRPGTTSRTGIVEVWAVNYANVPGLTSYTRRFLYHADADNSAAFPKSQAAFRYKDLLYTQNGGLTYPDFSLMSGFWGPNELQRSREAEAVLLKAISEFNAPGYGRLLLDIYYDRAAAEGIIAKEKLVLAERARLGPPLGPVPPASGFVIDNEIARVGEALTGMRTALGLYFDLFALAHPVDTNVPTLGYDVFKSLVPGLHLEPATVLVGGVPESVTGDDTLLFTGYRDLVMLYGLLKDYGQTARQLAFLQWANGNPTSARTGAAEAQQFLLVNGGLLEGIFPALDPATENDSGLDTAVAGWQAAIGDLMTLVAQLEGDSTPLGFDRNFLMLVQRFQGQNPELFDSFNSIKDWLNPTPASSQLRFALDRQAAARASYVTFRQNFDEVQEQYDQSTVSFEFRLFEITGARPEDPEYETPDQNEGSEIWQQLQSIDLARNRIDRNRAEIDNLTAEINIEISRATSVSNVVVRYGEDQVELTREIGHVRAAQAAAQGLADAFSVEKITKGGIFFHIVNIGAQTVGEEAVAGLEASKERLAAAEKASIEGIDSAARVQTLWLGMKTLELDTTQAAILMRQEIGRLAQLLREKGDLERRIREREANLARRYYADPIHRLTSQYDLVVANLAFDAAHKWLFFMVRALEYKWNIPFAHNHGGVNWNAGSVFKCRNGEELQALYLALLDFDGSIEGTRIKDDAYDWFSVRDDFFGYRQLDDQGQPLTYFDSVTGETVSAIEMFRRRLKRDYLVVQSSQQSQVRLSFSTVRQIPGGSFFRGPRFNPDGSVLSRGLYLDKIKWMKIRLPGNHTTSPNPLTGSLSYGGSSFIRNEQVGTIPDPNRPDRVLNEFTEYSTRYWYRVGQQSEALPGVPPLPDVWRFRESLTWDGAQMYKDAGVRQEGSAGQLNFPPSVLEIDAFRERSVAATDWSLTIPVRDLGSTVLNIDQLNDVEIYFYHYVVQRP